MTREEKVNLLNELLEIEEKNDIGNLTTAERREFQQWVEALEQESTFQKKAEIVISQLRADRDRLQDAFDKARDEIESIDLLAEYTRGDIKRMALAIIDKYKGYTASKRA